MLRFPPPSWRPRLLLSGEDDGSCRPLAEALRSDGYDVLQVSDLERLLFAVPPEFFAWPDPASFGLLVFDVQISARAAVTMVQRIRDSGWLMPMILVAAPSDAAARESATALGALLFEKPLDVPTLRAAVAHLLRPRLIWS